MNSLIPHIDEIEANIKEHGIHFLALNVTKISSDILSENLEIDGHKLGRKDRNRYGGGVAFYCKDTLRYSIRQDVPVSDLEILCFEITPPDSMPYIILVWYRPPRENTDTFDKLESVLLFWKMRAGKLSYSEKQIVIYMVNIMPLMLKELRTFLQPMI